MSNVLALKFSTASPEALLDVLSKDEVIDVLKERLRSEIYFEVSQGFEERIAILEADIDYANEDAAGENDRADESEGTALALYRAIEKAIELPWTEALPILRKAMEESGITEK